MKRSEVAYFIANYFYECNVEPEEADELGTELLTQLELMGMLPPSIPNPNFQGGWNIHTHPAYVNQWEPEDET